MKSIIPIASVIMLLGISSCEKIIDIDLPENERKIVINGLITPDSMVSITLSRSLSVLEPESLMFMDNALVKLYFEDELIGSLVSKGFGAYQLPGYYPVEKRNYRITAESGDLAPVYAFAEIPEPVTILSVDTVGAVDEWGGRMTRITIRFKDPEEQVNYYAIAMYSTSRVFDYIHMVLTDEKVTNPVWLGNSDPFLEEASTSFESKIFFDDKLFNGREKTIELEYWDYGYFETDTTWLDLRLEQVARPYYLYVISLDKYDDANGNPFAEPVQVYTNVEGGFGLFSAYTADSREFVITGTGR